MPDPDRAAAKAPPRPLRRFATSEELLSGARELVIRHGTEEYRLSVTRGGKLILTK